MSKAASKQGIRLGYTPIDAKGATTDFVSVHCTEESAEWSDLMESANDHFHVSKYSMVFDFEHHSVLTQGKRKYSAELQCRSLVPSVAMLDNGDFLEVSVYELRRNRKSYSFM